MKRLSLFSALLATAFCTAVASADVKVGDKPSLHFTAYGTDKTVDLSELSGKIVVVDFWATWCGPCMAEADHMVAVNAKYADKGLQFIGVSLDQDGPTMDRVAKEKKFTWPMALQGGGPIPKEWGIPSIPQTFIIGPDGTVLWRGHPGNLDEPLAQAFKDHPPQLVDSKSLAAAKSLLDQFDSALSSDQALKAVKSLASIPDSARLDPDTATRMKSAADKLQRCGAAELETADAMISAGRYTEAANKLRELSQTFVTGPTADGAKAKLASMAADPKVKKQAAAAKLDADSAAALAVADELKSKHNDELAYPRYKAIAKQYPTTPAATRAAAAVATYEADAPLMARLRTKADGSKAAAALSLADSYQSSGAVDKAKAKYLEIIAAFPGTEWSDKAKKALAAQ